MTNKVNTEKHFNVAGYLSADTERKRGSFKDQFPWESRTLGAFHPKRDTSLPKPGHASTGMHSADSTSSSCPVSPWEQATICAQHSGKPPSRIFQPPLSCIPRQKAKFPKYWVILFIAFCQLEQRKHILKELKPHHWPEHTWALTGWHQSRCSSD